MPTGFITNSTAPKLVDAVGVEPTMPCGRKIYSLLGLPIFLHIQNTSYGTPAQLGRLSVRRTSATLPLNHYMKTLYQVAW
jgi:hypothetical protein